MVTAIINKKLKYGKVITKKLNHETINTKLTRCYCTLYFVYQPHKSL